MGALTFFARLFFKLREKSINAFIQSPIKDQREILKSLLKKGRDTNYGEEFNFSSIHQAALSYDFCFSFTLFV